MVRLFSTAVRVQKRGAMLAAVKRLTFWEATCIITGYGVAGGIMAVPFLASLNGIAITLVIMVVAYLVSVLVHLMIAEMCSGEREGESVQLVEAFRKYLFRGRFGELLAWLFFGLVVLIFFTNLAAYVVGAGEIVANLTGWPLWAGNVLFYIVAAGIVAFGLKVLGISEKYAVAAIAVVFVVLAAGSMRVPLKELPVIAPLGNETLALFGMAMFCFVSFFSIPQAVAGLSWNRKLIPRSVAVGIGINFIFVLVVTFFALSVSDTVTPVAVIGWTGAIGGWATILGSVFFFLAMLTTYWSMSYALVVIIRERTAWDERLSWLAATLPTLVIAVAGLTDFLGFMRLVGGGIAISVAIMLVPAYRASRLHRAAAGFASSIGAWGGLGFQMVAVIAYIITAIGSFIEIPGM